MEFKASLDKTAKVITIGVGLVFCMLVAFEFVGGQGWSFMIPTGLVVLYLAVYLFSPQSYTVTQSSLIINRPIKNVRIRIRDIESVTTLENAQMNGAMRTFGVGGLFGYFGKFYNYGIGGTTWYMTRTDKAVLVRTKDKKIVLSPNDPEAFIAALKV